MTIEQEITQLTDQLNEIGIERAAIEERLREIEKVEPALRVKLTGLRARAERVKRTMEKAK